MKTSAIKYLRTSGLILLISFLLISCSKEDESFDAAISGFVQKGPVYQGHFVMHQMTNNLNLIDGNSLLFDTLFYEANGFYETRKIEFSSRYVFLQAWGNYFGEIQGEPCRYGCFLSCIADVKGNHHVNLNVLTSIEIIRVEELVRSGHEFALSKHKAQEEVLKAFGMQRSDMPLSETLNLYSGREEDAVLLALSIILSSYSTVNGVQHDIDWAGFDFDSVINNLRNDLFPDGIIDEKSIIADLRRTTLQLDLPKIRSNLEAKFRELGINNPIPDFEKYINDFISYSAGL